MMADQASSDFMLSDLLQDLIVLEHSLDRSINRICMDSRQIRQGDLFIACTGHQVKGKDYIDDAISSGAVAVVWENETDQIVQTVKMSPGGRTIPVIGVPELTYQVGVLADRFFGHPSQHMYVTGITGTNGKTSCSQFLAQVLAQDASCGIVGTLGNGLYGDLQETKHTTPDAIECHRLLADMFEQGARQAVMEVSSHALVQGRVNGVHFDCAIFTNLTHEHLDYHGNMENYADAKRRLFEMPGLDSVIINQDDEYGRYLIEAIGGRKTSPRLFSYGFESAYGHPDIYGYDLELNHAGIQMQIHSPWGSEKLTAPVLGRFNASNVLAVVSALLVKGLTLEDVQSRIEKLYPVAGRMQSLKHNGAPLIVIDYAHTPDALEQVLQACRQHTESRLHCVFGCGGNRDKVKRPMMGEIAERLADVVVLTSDNPRRENPIDIINDIRNGMNHPENVFVIDDRKRAIQEAIKEAEVDEVVLIAGKGHETYQEVGDVRLPFSDYDVALEYLEGHY